MNMGAFEALNQQEMMEVDGGVGIWAAIVTGATKAATAVGGLCGMGPVGGAVVIGCCVVAAGVGAYCAVKGVQ